MLMNGAWLSIGWNLVRNILGIFVGTAGVVGFAFAPLTTPMRIAFGAAALAILIPPHAFPGADMLDWFGLAGAVAMLAINWAQSRSRTRIDVPVS